MMIDHVAMLVGDAAEAASELRDNFGFGSERGRYLAIAGTRMHTVWLEPPQYLEFHTIESREVAATTTTGRLVLDHEAARSRMMGWGVLVDDLNAVSARLGIEIFDYTIPQSDGTLRGWRSVTGPPHLPFFIDYPNNGDRVGRMRALHERAGHTSSPTRFSELTISGSRQEMTDWLGPHDLPLRFVEGREGLCEAVISTANGDVVIA